MRALTNCTLWEFRGSHLAKLLKHSPDFLPPLCESYLQYLSELQRRIQERGQTVPKRVTRIEREIQGLMAKGRDKLVARQLSANSGGDRASSPSLPATPAASPPGSPRGQPTPAGGDANTNTAQAASSSRDGRDGAEVGGAGAQHAPQQAERAAKGGAGAPLGTLGRPSMAPSSLSETGVPEKEQLLEEEGPAPAAQHHGEAVQPQKRAAPARRAAASQQLPGQVAPPPSSRADAAALEGGRQQQQQQLQRLPEEGLDFQT